MPSKKRKKDNPKLNKLANNLTRTLLQFIAGKRYEPMNSEELASQLDIAPIHEKLFLKILTDLVHAGEIAMHRGCFSLPEQKEKLITGTISVHHKGFGFVKVEAGPDIFIPKHLVGDAVDGDTVEVEVASIVSAKGPEGAVVAILKRSRTHLAGTIVQKSGNHFTAYAPLLGRDKLVLVKAAGISLKEGDRIICKVTNWRTSDDLVEVEASRFIGHISDPSIDVEAAIQEFELPDGFSKEALAEAKEFGAKVHPKDAKERLDLTEDECVTIDPDTARDYDDAITLTRDDRGHFHLGVHIADVAHYVQPGSHLDQEAFLRCNSTYFPGQVVPMLPEELSNELCSLKPGVKRLTMSVLAEFNTVGDLVDYKIARTVIKSKKRFTYQEAFDILQKKKKSPHSDLLHRMVELCHLFKQKRFERGSIDFAMAEEVIMVDEKGVPLRMQRVEYDITHQMIEEFMLKANELTAIHLANEGKSLIYRVHEQPTAESFQDFYAFARSLGFPLPATPTHKDIQSLFQQAKDSPFLSQLSIGFIRSMRLAQYSPDNIGHYGLALEHYCHFTSPIRRYTDLIIQRLLTNNLPEDVDLQEIARACSEKERVSFKAESSVKLLKKMRLANTYFTEDPARVYPAIVTRVKPFALFFEVPMFDLESSLHVSEIGNDFYEYNANKLSFRGVHTGKTFTSGQTIHVQIKTLDFILQETKWVLTSEPATIAKPSKKKR
jgi:ribonuclease R